MNRSFLSSADRLALIVVLAVVASWLVAAYAHVLLALAGALVLLPRLAQWGYAHRSVDRTDRGGRGHG